MTSTCTIRRHADGCIDYDFYRARAVALRDAARRRASSSLLPQLSSSPFLQPSRRAIAGRAHAMKSQLRNEHETGDSQHRPRDGRDPS